MPELPAKPIIDIDVAVEEPVDESAYVPALESLGLIHWLTEHREDRELYAEAKRSALVRVDAPVADHGALGFGMRYNAVKQPVVREIYERLFRAAGLL